MAEKNGEITFRSDNRFRTLSISNGQSDGSSIGIEVWDEQAPDEIEKRLSRSGFVASRATALDCPEEFGATCAFLCSTQASYITGQNILIDGGAYPGTF